MICLTEMSDTTMLKLASTLTQLRITQVQNFDVNEKLGKYFFETLNYRLKLLKICDIHKFDTDFSNLAKLRELRQLELSFQQPPLLANDYSEQKDKNGLNSYRRTWPIMESLEAISITILDRNWFESIDCFKSQLFRLFQSVRSVQKISLTLNNLVGVNTLTQALESASYKNLREVIIATPGDIDVNSYNNHIYELLDVLRGEETGDSLEDNHTVNVNKLHIKISAANMEFKNQIKLLLKILHDFYIKRKNDSRIDFRCEYGRLVQNPFALKLDDDFKNLFFRFANSCLPSLSVAFQFSSKADSSSAAGKRTKKVKSGVAENFFKNLADNERFFRETLEIPGKGGDKVRFLYDEPGFEQSRTVKSIALFQWIVPACEKEKEIQFEANFEL
jgi:hypothetical protein